jgi:hypothetical protein
LKISISAGSTNIQIGGHRFAQESFRNNVFQIVDNLYYNTDKVKYTFGADLMYTTSKSVYGSEVNGRFHFREDEQSLIILITFLTDFTGKFL